jgi:hypothetical protein
LTVRNLGPDMANNVILTDMLPAGVSFVFAIGGCTHNAGVVTCDVGHISPGGSVYVMIMVTAPTEPGEISNQAQASADQLDPDESNNTVTVVTTVGIPYLPLDRTLYLPVLYK